MRFLILKGRDPYRNLAVEEYLFRHAKEDVFLLWQNDPTVVIGKNQNAYAELDLDYVRARGIRVARRITGGGAVYHDGGNINYSVIAVGAAEGELDFAPYTAPILEALLHFGVRAELSGRNDLLVGDRKISGNAQFRADGRVLHHGTLLYDSDLEVLSSALRVDEEKLRAKSIRSHRSRVVNIRTLIEIPLPTEAFLQTLAAYVREFCDAEPMEEPQAPEIDRLAERNASEAWLFPSRSYLADYTLERARRFAFGGVRLTLFMRQDRILKATLDGDYFERRPIGELTALLEGTTLAEAVERLREINVGNYIHGMTYEDFCMLLEERQR